MNFAQSHGWIFRIITGCSPLVEDAGREREGFLEVTGLTPFSKDKTRISPWYQARVEIRKIRVEAPSSARL